MPQPIIYIARDIERALGQEPKDGYFIITNSSPYALEIQKKYPNNIYLINSDKILDTYELLLLSEVQKIITDHDSQILVFKNTIHIEQLCKEKKWKLLNPSAVLSEKIENKTTQVAWLEDLSSLLPPHKISLVKNIIWNEKFLIIQWSHSHTGDGTILIQNEKDLDLLKEKFPHRQARVSDFIKGPMFTVNAIVTDQKILIGNISYQITGMLPFTENIFSTVGNDWSLPYSILNDSHIKKIEEIAQKIGEKMRRDGWEGLFGIDVIYDEERDSIRLIEINPRQPASTTYESELQISLDLKGSTIFKAHILSLTNSPIENPIIPINDGSQIIQRVTKNSSKIDSQKIIDAGYKVIKYNNLKSNSDFLRIQSSKGIMESHNKFNKRGKEILGLVTMIK